MDNLELIKLMASNIRHLDVDVKEVKVKYKSHPQSKKQQCFNNSFRELSNRGRDDSRYVLGYVLLDLTSSHVPIEHAWVKHGNEYFDVTLKDSEVRQDIYFSVCEFTFEEVMQYVDEFGQAPDLYRMNRFMDKRRK